MASLRGLTVEAVHATLAEFDAIGREAFLSTYDFGPAKGLYLVRDGKRYDSKAIVGAAIGRLPGRTPLRASEFTGGVASVVRALEKLGYTVVDERPPATLDGHPKKSSSPSTSTWPTARWTTKTRKSWI